MNDSAPNASAAVETSLAAPALVLANEACLRRHDLSVDQLIRLLAEVGLDAEVRESHDLPLASDLAARLAERPTRLLIAGGDGTIHHLVNAFAEAPEVAWPPIGIVPLGTANDFARSLGLPSDWRAALAVAAQG
ncbi:MAG: diacylglycerol/lipid kinase family protein, partial [Candidatus Sericytochromatia bacterium]